MRKIPSETLSSVDRALRLLHLLRDQGVVTVTEAAASLDVSVSSAHRLLSTLVYRDFAVQTEQRRYAPGPAMLLQPGLGRPVTALREVMKPAMQVLANDLGETITLSVRIDTRMRTIVSAIADEPRMLRVADQEGAVLPAHLTSSGKATLAFLDVPALEELYRTDGETTFPILGAEEWRHLLAELAGVRQNGFAINHGEAERGVTGIGLPVRGEGDRVLAGLATTMPSARFVPAEIDGIVDTMTSAVAGVAARLTLLGGQNALSEPERSSSRVS
jgi:IclR family acetate operon transcriptional repressor